MGEREKGEKKTEGGGGGLGRAVGGQLALVLRDRPGFSLVLAAASAA